MVACPTSIDIPMFIRQIQTGHPMTAAKTIFDQNILGGMCARVCPTETLCEEACVREVAEGKPVKIGLLQRHATDAAMAEGQHPFTRAAPSGKTVAVVGAGPAGLACAHRLAMHGHEVTVFEARKKSGGLNEYGIAAYKSVDGFAQREVDFILSIGGIRIEHGKALGKKLKLKDLQKDFDAVFLGIGLQGVNALGAKHEDADGHRGCGRLHRRTAAGEGPGQASRGPPGSGHRRRHDGDRCRRAVEAAGCGGRHHPLPARRLRR